MKAKVGDVIKDKINTQNIKIFSFSWKNEAAGSTLPEQGVRRLLGLLLERPRAEANLSRRPPAPAPAQQSPCWPLIYTRLNSQKNPRVYLVCKGKAGLSFGGPENSPKAFFLLVEILLDIYGNRRRKWWLNLQSRRQVSDSQSRFHGTS